MVKERWFSCVHCGTPFKVYPPDMNHPRASLEKPTDAEGTIIEMTYDCKNGACMKPTTLYWYNPKLPIAFG